MPRYDHEATAFPSSGCRTCSVPECPFGHMGGV